jgi:hypothetical protein
MKCKIYFICDQIQRFFALWGAMKAFFNEVWLSILPFSKVPKKHFLSHILEKEIRTSRNKKVFFIPCRRKIILSEIKSAFSGFWVFRDFEFVGILSVRDFERSGFQAFEIMSRRDYVFSGFCYYPFSYIFKVFWNAMI